MRTEVSSELEVEAHRRALQTVRLRAASYLVFVALLVCIPWLLGHPWLLIALAPLGAAVPRLVRMILRPELPASAPPQQVLNGTFQRQPAAASANEPAAERLVELQEQLDALEAADPRRWKLPFIGRSVAPLGILSAGILAVLAVVNGSGAGSFLLSIGLAGAFGATWWQSARRDRRLEEAKALLTGERDRLMESSGAVERPTTGH